MYLSIYPSFYLCEQTDLSNLIDNRQQRHFSLQFIFDFGFQRIFSIITTIFILIFKHVQCYLWRNWRHFISKVFWKFFTKVKIFVFDVLKFLKSSVNCLIAFTSVCRIFNNFITIKTRNILFYYLKFLALLIYKKAELGFKLIELLNLQCLQIFFFYSSIIQCLDCPNVFFLQLRPDKVGIYVKCNFRLFWKVVRKCLF